VRKYNFKIITWNGEAGLAELVRDGCVERVTLPMSILRDATELTDSEIDSGISYGLPFADFLSPSVDNIPVFVQNLHRAGVWTIQDLKAKTQSVVEALQATYRLEAVQVIQAAELYLQQEHKQPPVAPKKNKKEKL